MQPGYSISERRDSPAGWALLRKVYLGVVHSCTAGNSLQTASTDGQRAVGEWEKPAAGSSGGSNREVCMRSEMYRRFSIWEHEMRRGIQGCVSSLRSSEQRLDGGEGRRVGLEG